MAAVRHIGFFAIQIFNCRYGSQNIIDMHHSATFRAKRSSRCPDMAVLRFFKMAAVRHLKFVKV